MTEWVRHYNHGRPHMSWEQGFPSRLHSAVPLQDIGIGCHRLSVWERVQSWAACIRTIGGAEGGVTLPL